jgi:hypothetical protein
MARAKSPLPVPVSPWISRGGRRRPSTPWASNRSTVARTAWIAGLSPSSSARGVTAGILRRRGGPGTGPEKPVADHK